MVFPYTLVITDNDDAAYLDYATFEESMQMKRAFDNYGKYQSVRVIRNSDEDTNTNAV